MSLDVSPVNQSDSDSDKKAIPWCYISLVADQRFINFIFIFQLNEITPFLDGQVIYGPSRAWTDAIREFKGGRLAGTNVDNIAQSFPPNNTARLPYANPPVAREHVLKPVSRFQGNFFSVGLLTFYLKAYVFVAFYFSFVKGSTNYHVRCCF